MKTCPVCKFVNQDDAIRCKSENCSYRFVNNCEGCGRDVRGAHFCRECRVPGVHHFQRTEVQECGDKDLNKFMKDYLKGGE